MASRKLVISPAARNDLKDIYQYGLRRWGQARSDSYLTAIKDQFLLLLQQPLIGTERPELLPDSRSLALQSHILFYRVTTTDIEIIRILHGRQDPHRHLK